MRLIFKTFISSLCILFMLSLLLITLAGTQRGTQFILQHSQSFIPGQFSYAHAQGTLLDDLTLTDFFYKNKDNQVYIGHINIKWQPLKLFYKELSIKNLVVKNIQIKLGQTKNKPAKFEMPHFDLRLSIDLSRATFHNLHIQTEPKAKPIIISQALIAARITSKIIYAQTQLKLNAPFSSEAALHIDGELNHYLWDLQINNPWLAWQLHGQGNKNGLIFVTEKSKTLNGPTDIQGQLTWTPVFAWQLEAKAHDIHLRQLWPNMFNTLAFNINSHGSPENFTVNLNQIAGEYQGHPVQGQGKFVVRGKQDIQLNMTFNSQHTHIQAAGNLGNQSDLNWKLSIQNLAELWPNAGGSLNSEGKLIGSFSSPQIKGSLQAQALHIENYAVTKLNSQFNINLINNGVTTLMLNAHQLQIGEQKWKSLSFNVTGTTDAHQINAELTIDTKQKLALAAQGSWQNDIWRGQLQKLNLLSTLGHWHLAEPIHLQFAKKFIVIPTFCWINGEANVCGQISWQKQRALNTKFSIQNIALVFFKPWLPNDLKLTGKLNGNGQLRIDAQGRQYGQFNLKLTPGAIHLNNAGKSFHLGFNTSFLNANLDQQGLKAQLAFHLANQPPLTAELTLPDYQISNLPTANQTILAKINFQINHLDFLSLFIPQLARPTGLLTINYHINGTLGNPLFNGNINLQNGKAEIPSAGITLTPIKLMVTGKGNSFTYNGSAKSGQGKIRLNGQTRLQHNIPMTELHFIGKNFLASNTPELELLITPNLTVNMSQKNIHISGSIFIPSAEIYPLEFDKIATLSNDVVILQKKESTQSTTPGINVFTRVQLFAGKDVKIKVKGFSGRLTGKLMIVDEPQTATTATGNLIIKDGKYDIYGQTLNLTNGQLIYLNNIISNPNINITASQTMHIAPNQQSFSENQNVTVGITAQGSLNNPQITLFSDPAGMSQADILSTLVLGQPTSASGTKGGNTQLLMRAAQALTPGSSAGIGKITSQLQQNLGLNELGFQPEATLDPTTHQITQSTAFVLGKYLSPKLYLSYSLSIFNQINIFRVRYLLTKRWSIQTQSSSLGNGADLLYSFERK